MKHETKMVIVGGVLFSGTEIFKFFATGHLSRFPDFGVLHVIGLGLILVGIVLSFKNYDASSTD